MNIDNKIRAKHFFVAGLILVTALPFLSFMVPYSIKISDLPIYSSLESIVHSRSIKTSFPENAGAFLLSGLISLGISQVFITFASLRIGYDALTTFRDKAMIKSSGSGFIYDYSRPIVTTVLSIAALIVYVLGPVDLSVVCNTGNCLSSNPVGFMFFQLFILIFVYLANFCVTLWITAYFKLKE